MNKNTISIMAIGFIIGSALTWIVTPRNESIQPATTTPVAQHNQMEGMSMSMDDMSNELKTKQGEAFDKAFLSLMIDHHQGAIEMANLASTNAEHPEIKQLSEEIVAAQTKEIEQMRQWQTDWQLN